MPIYSPYPLDRWMFVSWLERQPAERIFHPIAMDTNPLARAIQEYFEADGLAMALVLNVPQQREAIWSYEEHYANGVTRRTTRTAPHPVWAQDLLDALRRWDAHQIRRDEITLLLHLTERV